MATDKSTGLPELPEGYFWRLRRSSLEYLRLEIREKRLIRSKVVTWSVIAKDDVSITEIQRTAILVKHSFKKGTNWKSYLGDYPPKKLGE